MKSRHFFASLTLGLGLTLALLLILGGRKAPVEAGSLISLATNENAMAEPAKAINAPTAEIHVCPAVAPTCDYTSIQDAVDAAGRNDVIKVATGVYTGVQPRGEAIQLVYVSKTVTIRGGYTTTDWVTADPISNPTTLDGQGQGRVFYVSGDVSPTIEGFRITGGSATGLNGGPGGWDAGGGLYIISTTATISRNWIFHNAAYGGGGLYLHRSAATLIGNTISSNTISDNGGGLYLFSSNATVDTNTIVSNTASDGGGGLYLDGSTAQLIANTVISNVSSNNGGGLYLIHSAPILEGNLIAFNGAGDQGGGLYLQDSDPTLLGNSILDNYAVLGGGLLARESSGRLDNNIIADNRATSFGSGLYVRSSSLQMRHATLARNVDGDGSGVYVTDDGNTYSTVALINTILVSHTVGIYVAGGNTATLEAPLWGTGKWANIVNQDGTGNILIGAPVNGDPAFVEGGSRAEAYRLTDSSAAIDAGVDAGVASDLDLDLRPIGKGFDIGADEFPIITTASQGATTTLVYTDPQGSSTELEIPTGAVTDTVTLIYTPKDPRVAFPLIEGLALGPHVFDLDIYRNGVHIPHFVFEKAVTLTIEYDQADVMTLVESTLSLYRKTEVGWEEVRTRPGERQNLDILNNRLTAYLLGTSRFSEMAESATISLALPLILRNN